jgi:hypothetical protein
MREEIPAPHPAVRQLLRYVQALFAQVSQTAARNARHALPQRPAAVAAAGARLRESNELTLNQILPMMIGATPGRDQSRGEFSKPASSKQAADAIVISDQERGQRMRMLPHRETST